MFCLESLDFCFLFCVRCRDGCRLIIFFVIFAVDIFCAEHFDGGENRYPDKHTQRPHDSTAYYNGKDDPQRAYIQRVPQNLGPQEVAVKLLQSKDEQTDPDAVDGADEQCDDDCGNAPQEWPEIRNHVGNADDQTQYQNQRRFDESQTNERQNADDQRVQGFAYDEALKDIVDTAAVVKNTVCCFFRSQSINDFPQLAQKVFFVKEHIKCNEDRHDQIEYETSHGEDVADEGCQHFGNSIGILKESKFSAACLQVFRNTQNRCQQSVDDVVHIFPIDEVYLHEKIFDLLVQCSRIDRKLFGKIHNRCFDLRHQINGNPDDAADDHGVDQRNGNGAGHPRMPLEKRVVFHGMPFKEIDEGIHDIGDHKAHEKRQTQTLCHFQKCMYGIADAGQVADDFFIHIQQF